MIKNIIYSILLCMLSVSLLVAADNADFFVVNVKGKILKKSDGQKWITVKNNDQLNIEDKISVGQKSFINLYDRNNKKYFVVHGSRVISLKDLFSGKINNSDKPVNEFLVKAFENLANAFSGLAESRNLKQLFRSTQGDDEIIALMPRNTKIYNDVIVYEWISGNFPIKLSLFNENFEVIYDTVVVGSNNCTINTKLESGKEYIWQLSFKNSEKNIVNYFTIADQSDIELFEKRLDSLNNLYLYKNTPNYHVLKGMICEESGFMSMAYAEFKKAYCLSTNNEKYGKVIEEFFGRSKLKIKYNDITFK